MPTIFALGLLISKADNHVSRKCIMLVKTEWDPRGLESTSSRWRKVLGDGGIEFQYWRYGMKDWEGLLHRGGRSAIYIRTTMPKRKETDESSRPNLKACPVTRRQGRT